MKQRALIVGLGKRGEKCWLKLILERNDIEIASIVVPRLERENELKQRYPLESVRWFRNLDDALNSDIKVDFALVLTPPQGHFEQIKKLMSCGIDVLSEKPLVMELEHGIQLAEMSRKTGRKLWIGQNFRYSQSTQYLYNTVKNNLLGSAEMSVINYIRNRDGKADWLNKYPLRMIQPMLFEQTEHHYDLIRYCYMSEIGKVYGITMNPSWSMYANEATVANLFELENGLIVNYFGTWSSRHGKFDFNWRTDFEKGVIIQKSLFGDIYQGKPWDEGLDYVSLEEEELFVSDTRILFNKFINREKLSNCELIPDIFDNLKTIALLFATMESDNSGKAIYMDEYLKSKGITKVLEG